MGNPTNLVGVEVDSFGNLLSGPTDQSESREIRLLFDRIFRLEKERQSILEKIFENYIGYEPENVPELLNLYFRFQTK